MSDDEKLMWMFEQVHGKISGACEAIVIYDDYNPDKPIQIDVVKYGKLCWSATKLDLIFEFLTKDLPQD
jgi:hypothetical protein